VLPQRLGRGKVKFRSNISCFPLGVPSPGQRRACVLFGVSFWGGYSPAGLPGDPVLLAFPPTGWGWLGVLSHHGGRGCRGQRARQATADRAPLGGCSAFRAEWSLPLVCNDRSGGLDMHGGNYLQ